MKISTGIDIVNIKRFEKKAMQPEFLKQIFTEKEITCANIQSLAGKFACKEAIKKADSKIINSWKDVEILNLTNGEPCASLMNQTNQQISISISHEKEYAIAIAIISSDEKNK